MTAITDGEQVGLDAVLAYNSGTHGSPTWVTVARAKDVSLKAPTGEATLNSRASKFEFTKATLIKLSLEFGYLYRRGTDSVFTALQAAHAARTPIEFWVGDDLITLTGAKGWRFYGALLMADYDQPLEDGMTYSFSAKPHPLYVTSALVDPDFYTI